jgi:hypothetical protein
MHREKKNYGNRHTMGIGRFNDRLIYFVRYSIKSLNQNLPYIMQLDTININLLLTIIFPHEERKNLISTIRFWTKTKMSVGQQ